MSNIIVFEVETDAMRIVDSQNWEKAVREIWARGNTARVFRAEELKITLDLASDDQPHHDTRPKNPDPRKPGLYGNEVVAKDGRVFGPKLCDICKKPIPAGTLPGRMMAHQRDTHGLSFNRKQQRV